MGEQINQAKTKLEKLKEAEEKAKLIIQAMQQKMDEYAKEMASQNAKQQKQKQELEGKFFTCTPNGNLWNSSTTKNSISIPTDGLIATNNSNINGWQTVSAEKGFILSADFPHPVLYYFEVARTSYSKQRILVGLSSGNIPDGYFVGFLPNSYAIQSGSDYCWLSGKTHPIEWPNGAIKPEWNGKGDVIGCGILLLKNTLSIFFTENGILMGKQIAINSTANPLYPTVTMSGNVSIVANFGNDSAKPFKFDINKCQRMVLK